MCLECALSSPAAGTGTGDDELLAIAGEPANVFEVAEFDLLDGNPYQRREVAAL